MTGNEQLNLTAEQMKLLENVYDGFIRQGANLKGEAKEEYLPSNQRTEQPDTGI